MQQENGGPGSEKRARRAAGNEHAGNADAGKGVPRSARKPRLGTARACALGALALSLGAGTGFCIWALLSASYLLSDLVWDGIGNALDLPAFPLLACTLGGVLIGLWNARFDSAPKPLEKVMADTRAKGGYSVGRVAPASVSFLLPIAFGGSVGPEAGLTGFAAAGCTWVGVALRKASGLDGPLSRAQKVPLYALGAVGGAAGAAAFSALFDGGIPLPRFGAASLTWEAVAWTVPLAVAGWALAALYALATRLAGRLSRTLGGHPVLKPTLCGLALGATALALPYVLFPGTEQAADLARQWTDTPAAILLATGVVKTVFVALCLNLGWNGGPFFPLIFCGVSTGFGIAAVTGADAMLCAAATSTALIAGFTRKPAMALLVMLLCFPAQSLPFMAPAALAGALLPVPGAPRRTARRARVIGGKPKG
ncbi:hypothetical protein B5F40_06050 [Gordonibacter sp. An230]|uniref:chloride channel protein n=1 Tax=Gordonibacter sp. An230 TaxID=1965592 RepID=UPI000B39C5C3|nr:chloride channel protein [Gordonibacter sp. An230]OUO90748.1 hypothetical protein B5F40_06050 [Gordonibacter sp. An230]